MTTLELINELAKYPPDMPVFIFNTDDVPILRWIKEVSHDKKMTHVVIYQEKHSGPYCTGIELK